MTRLLIRHPVLLPNTKTTIYLPHSPTTTHPIYPRLQLLFYLLSGDHSKTNEFQQKPRSSAAIFNIDLPPPLTTYCRQRKIDPLRAAVADGLNFLASLFQSGSSYSALVPYVNTARSALSSILSMQDNTKFVSHPLVSRLLKGVFEHRPSLPKYDVI